MKFKIFCFGGLATRTTDYGKKTQGVNSIIYMLRMELFVVCSYVLCLSKVHNSKLQKENRTQKDVREHEWEEPKFLSLLGFCSLIEK